MSKGKVTAEERIEAARACLDGRMSMKEAGRRLGVNSATVEIWVTRYEANGPSAFMWSGKRTAYPKELKRQLWKNICQEEAPCVSWSGNTVCVILIRSGSG